MPKFSPGVEAPPDRSIDALQAKPYIDSRAALGVPGDGRGRPPAEDYRRSMKPPDDRLPEELLAHARDLVRSRFGGGDWALAEGRLLARKSRLYCLQSPSTGRRVALKVYGSEPHHAVGASLQAAALQRFHPLLAAGSDAFVVPELYDFVPGERAMIMEWLDARTLEQVLMRAALNPAAHVGAIRRAGRWLRHFHEVAGIGTELFDPRQLLSYLERRVENTPAATRRLADDPVWDAALTRVDQMARRVAGEPVGATTIHGDFTSSNIMLAGRRVIGIDVWAHRRAAAVEDLGRLLVYLAMGDPFPVVARLGPAVGLMRRRSTRALFEGYGRLEPGEIKVFRFCVLVEALTRWLALTARIAAKPHFADRWKAAGARGLVQSLIQPR